MIDVGQQTPTVTISIHRNSDEWLVKVSPISRYAFALKPEDQPANLTAGNVEDLQLLPNEGESISLGPGRVISGDAAQGNSSLIIPHDLIDLPQLIHKKQEQRISTDGSSIQMVLRHKHAIREEFKQYTADLAYDIHVYEDMFDSLDSEIANEPEVVREALQQMILASAGESFYDYFNDTIKELNRQVGNFSREEHERHGFYFRRQMRPFIDQSPFLHRLNTKPRGYAGDAEMMRMIYQQDAMGTSSFGKLMHWHPMAVPAADAVRNRRKLISSELSKRLEKYGRSEPTNVLSVACGPAYELNDLIHTKEDLAAYNFTLLDQDEEAIVAAKAVVANLASKIGVEVPVRYLEGSVRTMLASRTLANDWGQFDFIYSMGLFDYLIPPVAKAVLRKLYGLLTPGGSLIIGNFHVENPDRVYMEYWGDWVLYYRTEADMESMVQGLKGATTEITFEESKCQMFLQMTRQGD